ncbi:MAG: conjugal transfer protein TraI [Flavisolibacter sp.]
MIRRFQFAFICLVLMVPAYKVHGQDPSTEITQQALIKVIKALDLKVQRLQTKTIWLQNAQKAMENTMSKLKLDEIAGWVGKQEALYEDYFNELWKPKDVISYYHKIKEMTGQQLSILNEFKKGNLGIRRDGHFSVQEVSYMAGIYSNILKESIRNLEKLRMVLESFTTQMSDAARVKIIDDAASAIQKNYEDIKTFTARNVELSLSRSREKEEVKAVQQLYGIK